MFIAFFNWIIAVEMITGKFNFILPKEGIGCLLAPSGNSRLEMRQVNTESANLSDFDILGYLAIIIHL